ncbi:MAG: hypothetical protein O4804_09050 [Trichodesmium sp. St11_bin5]|nr:hypothetical protein [Trichodesmium erythraeum GBRTRLIN201]MDE5094360.1 hypothetical protein [Trichodesmium sp. St11_bin5]MDT9342455.1 hypothetical protein [Trichodesmium erythraeum 21-75]
MVAEIVGSTNISGNIDVSTTATSLQDEGRIATVAQVNILCDRVYFIGTHINTEC